MSEPRDRIDVRALIDDRLADSVEIVRAYAGSDLSNFAVSMLKALIDGYQEDLKRVTVEELVPTQTKLRQCVALLEIFENVGMELPRI
jgi:hypothetical protein